MTEQKSMPNSRMTRRDFFARYCDGVHGAALAWLMSRDLFADSSLSGSSVEGHRTPDLRPRPAHFASKAKAVIHLFMNGGPSQVDLFDPKPLLSKFAGSPPSRDILAEIEFADQVGTMLPSPFQVRQAWQVRDGGFRIAAAFGGAGR